ncbi:MAG TPA: hypothetical protein DCQ32_02750 [Cyanobacteria bacterium UBA8156]|jgi:hypothetical protein|nr:hypothetical protein [Cyanobacteria bacterium UBA8156]
MNPSIFFQSLSKSIIDEIVGAASPMENRVLVRHYGFSDEELDDLIKQAALNAYRTVEQGGIH